jgi:hypothetical protein
MKIFKRRLSDHNVYLVSVMLNLLRTNFLAFFKLFKLLVMENTRSTQFKLCQKNENLKGSNIIKKCKTTSENSENAENSENSEIYIYIYTQKF